MSRWAFFCYSPFAIPSAHRSLIAFTAWSSLVHAVWMGTQAFCDMVGRGELIGVAVLIVIGIALVILAPAQLKHIPGAELLKNSPAIPDTR